MARITAGVAQSFYDFWEGFAVHYRSYMPSSGTGDTGWWVFAYTAQLGNGLSATISAEQRRMSQIIGFTGLGPPAAGAPLFSVAPLGNPSLVAGTTTIGLGYGGLQVPDIVGNIRLDQTWGGAQVMAAAHQVNATYYGCNTTTGIGAAFRLGSANANGLSETGHPGDEGVGWSAPACA